MKTIFALTVILMTLTAGAAFAGPCDHSWQTASDGSACGNRAADVRPGGR